jgi:2-keto-4-pentenoate hydratase/2-oxohepta-3-ene-1,7-dioic acid hydratase in catechol pathway
MYQHRNWQGALLEYGVNKVVCVGNNYLDHIKEMKDSVVQEPMIFIKPETALCDIRQPIALPKQHGEVHHEIELAVLIGLPLKMANESQVAKAIAGYGIALDLTLRDMQTHFRQSGQPWEKCKGFDGSCPISGFISANEFGDAQSAQLQLSVNGQLRQQGNTRQMLTPIIPLIAYMSQFFTLRAGDIILTGTPEGVGALHSGDQLEMALNDRGVMTRIL